MRALQHAMVLAIIFAMALGSPVGAQEEQEQPAGEPVQDTNAPALEEEPAQTTARAIPPRNAPAPPNTPSEAPAPPPDTTTPIPGQPMSPEPQPEGPMTADKVLSDMHQMNNMQIEMGQMALDKGTTAEVRRFGDRLMRDHKVGDDKVVGLADELGIALMEMPPKPEQMKMKQNLQSASGEAFDQAYIEAMRKSHQQAIKKLTMARDTLDTEEVVDLAAMMIPIMEQHRDLALHLQGVDPESVQEFPEPTQPAPQSAEPFDIEPRPAPAEPPLEQTEPGAPEPEL